MYVCIWGNTTYIDTEKLKCGLLLQTVKFNILLGKFSTSMKISEKAVAKLSHLKITYSTWFLNDIHLSHTDLKCFSILCKSLPFRISLLARWTPGGITVKSEELINTKYVE